MASKLLKLFRTKKNDKENFDKVSFDKSLHQVHEQRHVNFKHPESDQYDEEDDDDDGSEVTLRAYPPPNPYHVITEPKRNRGPRSFAGENLSSNNRRNAAEERGRRHNSFRSEFQADEDHPHRIRDRRLPNPMSSNPRSIFKEVGNKSVGWAQQNTKAKSSIARNNNDQYIGSQQFVENDFDVVWMSADRMHQYQEKIWELTRQLEGAINAQRRERQKRRYYQDQLKEQTEVLRMENEQCKAKIQTLDNELNYLNLMFKKNDIDGMMLQVSQQMLHGGPSATPVSTTQTANSGVIGYQNLHNGTLLRQNHQIPNSNQIPFVNENQSLFTPYSYNHYQRMLGNNYIAHPNELPATMGINSEQDVVKNYRSLQHTNSFSGSPTSRPGTNDKLELLELIEAGIAPTATVNSSTGESPASQYRARHHHKQSPELTSSPEVDRNGSRNGDLLNSTFTSNSCSNIYVGYANKHFGPLQPDSVTLESGSEMTGDDGYSTSSVGLLPKGREQEGSQCINVLPQPTKEDLNRRPNSA